MLSGVEGRCFHRSARFFMKWTWRCPSASQCKTGEAPSNFEMVPRYFLYLSLRFLSCIVAKQYGYFRRKRPFVGRMELGMSVQIQTYVQRMHDGDLLDRWRQVPTSVVADLQHGKQVDPSIRPIRPAGSQPRLFGFAVTARCEPPDFGAVLHSMDLLQFQSVLVIAANGHRETAMIGDILGGYARKNGATGLVCDGAVRDVGRLTQWDDFSVYARSVAPLGPRSGERGAVNIPVGIGGKIVSPGDLVLGDDDGVVVLSPEEVVDLIDGAEEKLRKERAWESAFSSGETASRVFCLPRS
ncbi:RraA family protein [Agrobacterium sp. D14]|uniref:RraA family protein n=2 Tax=Agrobacterium TaxID=357 RepID=UPI001FD974EB|nr:dimethylmenaquinone methyltransferase [Agrobacterium sp. D14]